MRSVASRSVLTLAAAAGYALARFTLASQLGPEAAQAIAYPAIALSAWAGGVGSGIATTGLCALTGMVTRVYPGMAGGGSTWAGLGVLVVTGLALAVMIG